MKINLDKIEQTAKAAQADTRYPSWAHARLGGNARAAEHIATCSPDVVLAMVARIRELEAGLIEAADIACVQMTQEDYRRMGELEALARER